MAQRAPDALPLFETDDREGAPPRQKEVRLRNVKDAGWQLLADAEAVRFERVQRTSDGRPTGELEQCDVYDKPTRAFVDTLPAWVRTADGNEIPAVSSRLILGLWGSGRYRATQYSRTGKSLGKPREFEVADAEHPPKPARCGGPDPLPAPPPPPAPPAVPPPIVRAAGRAFSESLNLNALDGGTVLALLEIGEDRAAARHTREMEAAEARHRREMEHSLSLTSRLFEAQAQNFQLAMQARNPPATLPAALLERFDQRFASLQDAIESLAGDDDDDEPPALPSADAPAAVHPYIQMGQSILETIGVPFVERMMARAGVAPPAPPAASNPSPPPPVVERVTFDPPARASNPAPAASSPPPVSTPIPARPVRLSPAAVLATSPPAPAAPSNDEDEDEDEDEDDDLDDEEGDEQGDEE